LILGLGVGTNTAIFSLIDAVLFNPLPFRKAEQLVQISQPPTAYSQPATRNSQLVTRNPQSAKSKIEYENDDELEDENNSQLVTSP
jgi:hypothetical protein